MPWTRSKTGLKRAGKIDSPVQTFQTCRTVNLDIDMRITFIALITALLTTVPLAAKAAERQLVNTSIECGFVIINGQPVERRFPDAQQQSGQESIYTAVKNGVEVQIDIAARTCTTLDVTVAFENAESLVQDIAHGVRLVDLEKTSYGRLETAYRGYFNGSQPVLLVYTANSAGGTAISLILE